MHLVGLSHVYHICRQELGDFQLLLPIFKLKFHTVYSCNDIYIYTVRQLYNETDFILNKIEVPSMKQCVPSM